MQFIQQFLFAFGIGGSLKLILCRVNIYRECLLAFNDRIDIVSEGNGVAFALADRVLPKLKSHISIELHHSQICTAYLIHRCVNLPLVEFAVLVESELVKFV